MSLCLLLLQATAEQIRLAQMIYDKNDADFEDKVNQVRIAALMVLAAAFEAKCLSTRLNQSVGSCVLP